MLYGNHEFMTLVNTKDDRKSKNGCVNRYVDKNTQTLFDGITYTNKKEEGGGGGSNFFFDKFAVTYSGEYYYYTSTATT